MDRNEYISKLEEKIMYALGPKHKEFSENTKDNFRKIIRDNIDNDTYTIKEEFKKFYKNMNNYWKELGV